MICFYAESLVKITEYRLASVITTQSNIRNCINRGIVHSTRLNFQRLTSGNRML